MSIFFASVMTWLVHESFVTVQVIRSTNKSIKKTEAFDRLNDCKTWANIFNMLNQHQKENPKLYSEVWIPPNILHKEDRLSYLERKEPYDTRINRN